jgi:hypothetical protein
MNRLLFGLLLLAACSSDVTAPLSIPDTELVVVVSISPSTFRAGDSVTVVVTVVNRSDLPQAIELNQCNRAFAVTTAEGLVVGPDAGACLLYSARMDLKPGASYSWSVPWFGRGSAQTSTPALKPGDYVVTGAETIPWRGGYQASMSLVPSHIQVIP